MSADDERGSFLREHAGELFLEEYRSVRQESLQAQQALHSIFQWSIAAFALLFAGGLALVARGVGKLNGEISVFVFGLLIPGGAYVTTMLLLGEIGRMVRAGAYLRSREQLVTKATKSFTDIKPLNWESTLRVGGNRLAISHIAALAIYGGGLVGSLLVAIVVADRMSEREDVGVLVPLVIGVASFEVVVFVIGVMVVGLRLLRRGRSTSLPEAASDEGTKR